MLEPTNLEIACSPGISYSVWQTEPIFSTESRTILTISVISLSLIPTQLTSSSSSHQSLSGSDSIQFKSIRINLHPPVLHLSISTSSTRPQKIFSTKRGLDSSLVRSLSFNFHSSSTLFKKNKKKKIAIFHATRTRFIGSKTGAKILTKTLTFPPRIHPL